MSEPRAKYKGASILDTEPIGKAFERVVRQKPMSAAEYRELVEGQAPAKPNKYRAKRTEYDGRVFDSKAELARYKVLQLMEREGMITGLRCQVPYPIVVNGIQVCKYVADFVYVRDGKTVTEDTKGVRTPLFILKKKLMKAALSIDVIEV